MRTAEEVLAEQRRVAEKETAAIKANRAAFSLIRLLTSCARNSWA
jgi:hypothetical protein